VLQAAAQARDIADFILVGDYDKIHAAAEGAGADISGMEIIHEADDSEACRRAVQLTARGGARALMKGLADTSVIMRAVLDKDAGMRTGRLLSHLAVFEVPTYHKLLFVTDAAINIAPDTEAMKEIILNAAEAVASLGIASPKAALLAAKEKADPRMPATVDAARLAEMYIGGGPGGCILDGPLALDNAISGESAKIKGIESPVAGDADILVCPDIEAGNILYKALAFLAGAKNGGVVLGASRPVILTSRADSANSKYISIALGIAACERIIP
jgi:phosphate butyryltransferase